MPSLPQYDSQQNINITSATVRNQVDQPFKDQQQMLDTLSNVTQKLSNANDVMQETKAKVTVETALAQQEKAAQSDPNPENVETHLKAIESITKDASKGIDNQEVAGRVNLELQQAGFLSGIKVQDLFIKKHMLANDLSLDALATTASQNKANAVSPAAGQQVEDNFMQTISKNVNTGLITPQRGMDLVKNYKIGVVKTKITQNSSTNPDDYKGLSDGLDLKESDIVDKMVKARIKENQETVIKQTLGNRVDTIKKVASGELTWRDADKIQQVAKYDPKLAESLQATFENKIKENKIAKDKKETDKHYSDLINSVFNSESKEDLQNEVLKLLHESSDKENTSNLVDAISKRADTLPTKKTSDDAKQSPMQQSVDSSVQSIQELSKDDPQKSSALFSSFFKNLAGGGQPDVAKNDAIKTYNLKTYAWIGNLPKDGAVFMDRTTGAKRRLYPDGSAKEEQ